MRLISRKSKQDILKVKLYCISPDAYEKTFSFENENGYLLLNYYDEIILYFIPMNNGKFWFQMKTVRCGTNSDNYFWGDVEIDFIGQLLEKGILEWEVEVDG